MNILDLSDFLKWWAFIKSYMYLNIMLRESTYTAPEIV